MEERRKFLQKSGEIVLGLASKIFAGDASAADNKPNWMMIIDLNRCIGCQSCVIACKGRNRTPEGLFNTKIDVKETRGVSMMRTIFTPLLCRHCETPACATACRDEAIAHDLNGIVTVDPEKCKGAIKCKSKGQCVKACSQKANYINPVAGNRVEKCDFCKSRLAEGLFPVCVENCPSGARLFGNANVPKAEFADYLKRQELSTPRGARGRLRYVTLRGAGRGAEI